ncbi:hypothetical protein [Kitasatospora sp. SolWspMP-SS2h]|uniref:hypothetical protein n=1 Tax=Kitasatospora sp. SolWspMP-SS2h TaxID=1305729 RepID=UPI0011B94200|nr:hypothetical protein [Kitasatospora sp. SolWspMP-SS2h]
MTILLVFAAFSTLSTLRALVTLIWPAAGRTAGDLPVVLLSAAFTAALCWVAWWVRRSADRRRTAGGRPLSDEQWQLAHAIWQRAWLCRGCRAVFFPAGAFQPDAPASRALSFEHFHAWLVETAWHAGATDAATGRSPAANTG